MRTVPDVSHVYFVPCAVLNTLLFQVCIQATLGGGERCVLLLLLPFMLSKLPKTIYMEARIRT